MNINLNKFIRSMPFFSRDKSGQMTYIPDNLSYGELGRNLEIAQNHPILTPAILFVSKLYSQAKIGVYDKRTNEEVIGHPVTMMLKNPNMYQTMQDFFEEQMFVQIAQGKSVVYAPKKYRGSEDVDSLYVLDADLIEYPADFKTPLALRKEEDSVMSQIVKYDRGGQDLDIELRDLIFIYDLPNGINKFQTDSCSRLDGMKQVLQNTVDSQIAKNIVIKSNGKEMITTEGGAGTFPLGDEEKRDAQGLFDSGYGLGRTRKRGFLTKANLKWQSLHIALRDLGLDESTKVDGNMIFTGLHIPKDILSLEAKKTTYDNFKQSMASYLQNELTPSLNASMSSLNSLLGSDVDIYELRGSYDHLSIMQFVLKERYEVSGTQAASLDSLLKVGVPQEIALDMCGFDKNLKLTPNESNTEQQTEGD